MKKYLSILFVLLMVCQLSAVAFAEQSCTITLNYTLEGYPVETVSCEAGSKLGKALANQDFQNVSRNPYGLDFDGWFYDEACTQAYSRQDKVSEDMTLYAKWTAWDADRAAMMEAWLAEWDICKELFNNKPMYTPESYAPFEAGLFKGWGAVGKASWEDITRMQALRNALVPVCEKEDVVWDIWGEQVPSEDTSGYDFYLRQDRADFRPLLTVFLLDDQTQAKGNIIICSGGARETRGNAGEGYTTAAHMNALGYNCYVLQYRLLPYEAIDSYLDLQRAIRYIRYHAEEKGIGAIENIATIGFSAGSGVVLGQVAQCYGDILPSKFYPDYVPDEIDMLNSDVTVAGPIYGPWVERAQAVVESGNPNIPAMFAAVGTRDSLVSTVCEGFLMLNAVTPSELHVYEGVTHGFGMGDNFAGADQIDQQFDAFLMVHFGLRDRHNH